MSRFSCQPITFHLQSDPTATNRLTFVTTAPACTNSPPPPRNNSKRYTLGKTFEPARHIPLELSPSSTILSVLQSPSPVPRTSERRSSVPRTRRGGTSSPNQSTQVRISTNSTIVEAHPSSLDDLQSTRSSRSNPTTTSPRSQGIPCQR